LVDSLLLTVRKKWDFTGVQNQAEKHLNPVLQITPGYQLANTFQITSACLYIGISSEMSNADLESTATTKEQCEKLRLFSARLQFETSE